LLDHSTIPAVRNAERNEVPWLFVTASVFLLEGHLSSFYTV